MIGGYAATLYGSALISHETSISVTSGRRKNIKRLVSALRPYHPRLRGAPEGLPFLFDVATLSNGMNFTLATDLGDIDLLGHLSGLGRVPGCRARRHFHAAVRRRVSSSFSQIPSSVRKGPLGQEQRPECPAGTGGAKRNACAKRKDRAVRGLTAKLAIGRGFDQWSAVVPKARRQSRGDRCARHSLLFPSRPERLPKKAMSLLNVSTCMLKAAATLSVSLWP